MNMSDLLLTARVVWWLEHHGCTTSVINTEKCTEVHYTFKLDVKPQPPFRIKDGKISIPTGSQEAVVELFLSFLLGG